VENVFKKTFKDEEDYQQKIKQYISSELRTTENDFKNESEEIMLDNTISTTYK
jgi:hypothetical protein